MIHTLTVMCFLGLLTRFLQDKMQIMVVKSCSVELMVIMILYMNIHIRSERLLIA